MKSIMTMLILALTLLTSSTGYAAPAQNLPVRVDGQGITFPDNTLQTSAAILPVCQPGEVYVKANTGMLCAKVKLIPNGIATCIDKVCTVSSCIDGIGNCDGLAPNVCGTDLQSSASNCGACGAVCSTNIECQQPTCSNGVCGSTNKAPGAICSTGICDVFGSCVQPVCGDGIVSAGEQCDDGNATSGDGCSSTCQTENGYFCSGSPSTCSTICGDGIIAGTEQCDDGNNFGGDGCSATCQIENTYSCSGQPSACFVNGCIATPCAPAPGPTCSNGNLTLTTLSCTPTGNGTRTCSYPTTIQACLSGLCNGNVCSP